LVFFAGGAFALAGDAAGVLPPLLVPGATFEAAAGAGPSVGFRGGTTRVGSPRPSPASPGWITFASPTSTTRSSSVRRYVSATRLTSSFVIALILASRFDSSSSGKPYKARLAMVPAVSAAVSNLAGSCCRRFDFASTSSSSETGVCRIRSSSENISLIASVVFSRTIAPPAVKGPAPSRMSKCDRAPYV
jgi:hypothetical protein